MEHLGLALILFATFWIGTFAGYMAMKMRATGQYEKGKAEAASEAAQYRERVNLRDQQLSELQKKTEALEQEHLRLQAEVKVISDQKSQFEVRANLLPKYEQEVEARGQRIMQLATDLARMQGALADSQRKLEELKSNAAPTNAAEFQASIQAQLQKALGSLQLPAGAVQAPNVDWKAVLAPLAQTLQTVEQRVQSLAEQAAAVQIPTPAAHSQPVPSPDGQLQNATGQPGDAEAANGPSAIAHLEAVLTPLQETLGQLHTKIAHLEAGQQAAQEEVRQTLAATQNAVAQSVAAQTAVANTVASTVAAHTAAPEAPAIDWNQLLTPLQETLLKVEARIESLERQPAPAVDISEQVNALQAAAKTLVDGLKKPNPRTRWSNMQLRRLVELAGMNAYSDFLENKGEAAENAPELLVRLPQGRVIAVDAKVPVGGYFDAMEADSPAEQQTKLAEHTGKVRAHLEFLASQSYWNCFTKAPEFVVAYLPGETFYGHILEQDPQLLEYCVERKVLLATPTTLIALLKTIGQGWEHNQRNDEAAEIRKLAHLVAEKLNDLAANLNEVHRNLELTNTAFSRTLGAWEGSLMPVFAKLQTVSVAPISDEARTNQSIQFLAQATLAFQSESPVAPPSAPASQDAAVVLNAASLPTPELVAVTADLAPAEAVSQEALSPELSASAPGLSLPVASLSSVNPVAAPPALNQEVPNPDLPAIASLAALVQVAAPVGVSVDAVEASSESALLTNPAEPAAAETSSVAATPAPAPAELQAKSLADLLVASPFEALRKNDKA